MSRIFYIRTITAQNTVSQPLQICKICWYDCNFLLVDLRQKDVKHPRFSPSGEKKIHFFRPKKPIPDKKAANHEAPGRHHHLIGGSTFLSSKNKVGDTNIAAPFIHPAGGSTFLSSTILVRRQECRRSGLYAWYKVHDENCITDFYIGKEAERAMSFEKGNI